MGYTDTQWEADDDRIHRWPLPDELEARLLTPEAVVQALENGQDAVDLSISKWQGIHQVAMELANGVMPYRFYAALQKYIGADSCALCLSSKANFVAENGPIKFNEQKCTYCPLANIDQCTEDESVFSEIYRALLRNSSDAPSPSAESQTHRRILSLIETMIEHLKSIKNAV